MESVLACAANRFQKYPSSPFSLARESDYAGCAGLLPIEFDGIRSRIAGQHDRAEWRGASTGAAALVDGAYSVAGSVVSSQHAGDSRGNGERRGFIALAVRPSLEAERNLGGGDGSGPVSSAGEYRRELDVSLLPVLGRTD